MRMVSFFPNSSLSTFRTYMTDIVLTPCMCNLMSFQNHPTSISLPGLAACTLSKNSGKSSHGMAATSVTLLQRQAFSEGRLGSRDSHPEASHQETTFQQAGAQLLVTQGPVTLTSWYLIKIQDVAVGR